MTLYDELRLMDHSPIESAKRSFFHYLGSFAKPSPFYRPIELHIENTLSGLEKYVTDPTEFKGKTIANGVIIESPDQALRFLDFELSLKGKSIFSNKQTERYHALVDYFKK